MPDVPLWPAKEPSLAFHRSSVSILAPLACGEVEFEAVAIVEETVGALEGNGEDDGLRRWQVGVHPAVAYVEVGGLEGASNLEDGGGLRAEGLVVANVGEGRPPALQTAGIGELALVGRPPCAGRGEHEVAVGYADDDGGLAALSDKEGRVLHDAQIVVGQAEESDVLILIGGGDEIGGAVVVDEHVAVATLDAQRPAGPLQPIVAVDGGTGEAGGLGGAVVARLPMAPHDPPTGLRAVEQLGTLNHAAAPKAWVGDAVLNDLLHERPVDEVGRRVEVHVGIPRVGAVFAHHVPQAVLLYEAGGMGLDDGSLGGGPGLTVPNGDPRGVGIVVQLCCNGGSEAGHEGYSKNLLHAHVDYHLFMVEHLIGKGL